jgi:hypothetical protein
MKLRMLLLLPVLAASLFAQTGARYLIITNDNFYNAIQPLAEWKTKKGMPCTVVKTSQTGTSSTQIRSYIVNAYNTWNPRPEFVLLVGSGSYLPSNSRREGQGYAIETDNPYGNVSGDYQAELPYGRFPCNSVRQCSVMVAKTLDYERTPDTSDTSWYHHATTVCRDSTDDDAPTYWSDIRTVISEAVANGFSSFDSLASSRLQDSLDIRQSVNNGTAFVLYRGRGTNCWYSPFDMRPYLNLDSLTNDKRLPIVCSFTCQTMNLANDTVEDMTGNTWVKVGTVNNPCGAVAVVGNTHSASGVALVRSSMTRGYFTGVFAESLKTVGAAMLRGKLQIYNDWHDSIYYMGFNLLGDPELNLWTTAPQPMAVDYDSLIPSGPDTFDVMVTGADTPVANALVCIRSNSGIYQYGCTDASGRQSFIINDSVGEMLDVTVTARNHMPYEGQARVYPPTAVQEKPGPQSATRNPNLISIVPNPGRMRFVVTTRPNARISIHSADGRLVWTGSMPGSSTLTWNAQTLPVGIYVVSTAGRDGGSARALLRLVR